MTFSNSRLFQWSTMIMMGVWCGFTASGASAFSIASALATSLRHGIRPHSARTIIPNHQIIPTTTNTIATSSSSTSSSTTTLYSASRFLPSGGQSLIAHNDAWGNWFVLLANAALAQRWGQTTTIGRLLGAPVSAMALTFVMATCGVLPTRTTSGMPLATRQLQSLTINLATPLVLLGADWQNAAQRCGPLLLSFGYAATATVVAGCLGWTLVAAPLLAAQATTATAFAMDEALKIAAALLAKNIGGGLNYMAVCTSLRATPTAIAAGLCIDNIFALLYFPACSIIANGRADPGNKSTARVVSNAEENSTATMQKEEEEQQQLGDTSDKKNNKISIEHVTEAFFSATALLWLGQRIGGNAGATLPVCTLLTMLATNCNLLGFRQRIIVPMQASAQVLGTVALYVFFSTAGAPGLAVADSVRSSILPLGLFLTTLYGIHGLILFGLHTFFLPKKKRDNNQSKTKKKEDNNVPNETPQSQWAQSLEVPRLLCASSAAIGGPATAVALAQSIGWKSLEVPSLLVGNIGYAIATFLGLAFHSFFSAALR